MVGDPEEGAVVPNSGASAPHDLTPSFSLAYPETARVVTGGLSPTPHRGWSSRGYVPHWDHPGLIQSLTFRLHDAVPSKLIEQWKAELGVVTALPSRRATQGRDDVSACAHQETDPDASSARWLRLVRRIQKYEDAGHGACWLQEPRVADVVEAAMLFFDGQRYRLIAWCIMPNHVHVVIETTMGHPLSRVVHAWKSYTATQARRVLGHPGPFWFREYFDRYVRDSGHFERVVRYVEGNPVKAGLVERSVDWKYSSARRRAESTRVSAREGSR